MIGDYLRKVRTEQGLRLKDVAEEVGVTPTTISRWEKGDRQIAPEYLQRVSEALGVDKRELTDRLGGSPVTGKSGEPGRVRSEATFAGWFNALSQSGIDTELFMVLIAIGREASTPPWVASVSIDYLLQRTPLTRELLERMWPKVLESDWLERRGSGEWTFILKLPEPD